MVLLGLLVIALVCLVVGLVLPSVSWLLASLIATAGAGFLLWRIRRSAAAVAARAGGGTPTGDAEPVPAGGVGDETTEIPVVLDAEPLDVEPLDAEPLDAPHEIDDRRGFDVVETLHDRPAFDDVETLDDSADVGHADAIEARDAEVPDAEDDRLAGLPLVAGADDVWVIDGRPRYHLGDCPIIQGQDAEPIPWDQATEDGFMPCSLCEPDAARLAASGG